MIMTRNPGRAAGLVYLLLTIAAPLRLLYIPNALFVHNDAAATARNLLEHETLFRLGIVSELACGVILVFVVVAFYRLFKGVDRTLAVLVVILGGVIPATIDFVGGINDSAALMLARGADVLSVFEPAQREALAVLFLRLHHQQVLAAEILWGLWLFPLGLLVYRSRFLPRFIGVWLFVNGVAYLATSLVGLLAPQYEDVVGNVTFPALLGEVALMLWLVIRGVKEEALAAAS